MGQPGKNVALPLSKFGELGRQGENLIIVATSEHFLFLENC